ADPDHRLSTLPLMDDAEAHRLLIEWNATATSYPRQQSITARFEAQVDAAPHAVALVSEAGSLTYEELDQRANRLAHHLRAARVGPLPASTDRLRRRASPTSCSPRARPASPRACRPPTATSCGWSRAPTMRASAPTRSSSSSPHPRSTPPRSRSGVPCSMAGA